MLLAGFSAGEFREFSPQHQDFVSLEIGEGLSAGLSGEGLAQRALGECLGNLLFFDDSFDFATLGSSEDLHGLFGELESLDGDDLPLNVFTVDQDSLVADDMDNGGELALAGTECDSGDATNLDKSVVALNRLPLTISKLW